MSEAAPVVSRQLTRDAALSSDESVTALLRLLTGKRIVALTGAGVSTDSGIPDYRGAGTPVHTPMSYQTFLRSDAARKRYWAGSHLGWRRFNGADPNAGHTALADLERSGLLTGLITQNVDSLHVRAGSTRLVELHGAMRDVCCIECGGRWERAAIAARIEHLNPELIPRSDAALGPDGDAAATPENFVVPECATCGGILRPDVVFFGEFVPPIRFAEAADLIRTGEALLIAGSSLTVNSGVRLVDLARKLRMPIAVVNRGGTKVDRFANVTVNAGTSETLATLARQLAL